MRWGGWDWVRASSGCPNVSEGSVVGPDVVEDPSKLRSSANGVVETLGGSQCSLYVRGARIGVSRRVRHVLLHEHGRGGSRSRDLFGFREERVVRVRGGGGGGSGGWRGGGRVREGGGDGVGAG